MGGMTNLEPDEISPDNQGAPHDKVADAVDQDDEAGFQETQPMPVLGQGIDRETLDSDLAETKAILIDSQVDGLPSPQGPEANQKSSLRRKIGQASLLVVLIITVLVLGAVLSGLFGYWSGIDLRSQAESTAIAGSLIGQYNLGLENIETGNWDMARQRFEYILQQDPAFPGAADQLTLILIQINTTATPTIVPTPTLTPTPDTRSQEDRFRQAEEYLANNDWTNTIDTLLILRKEDPAYRAVAMDGMLYLALRNRGMDKIGKQADLEGGIYDLALAERFGPLDTEALSYLNWARLYITGASFWEVNWEEAVNYFSQIAPQLPYLRDGSALTASERYRQALIGLGKFRVASQPCAAKDPLLLALSMAPDEEASLALEEANRLCGGGGGDGEDKKDDNSSGGEPPTPDVEIPPTDIPPTAYPAPNP
jgi:tetratricopeptide (TPR) repeat protein